MKNEFNPGRAMQVRIMRAVDEAGGRDAICSPIIAVAFEIAKSASIEQMRTLGGFSAICEGLIEAAHTGEIRSYLLQNLDYLRESVQVAIVRARNENHG